jgi:uncharacterized membrane protein HdeD (DUF308 family)
MNLLLVWGLILLILGILAIVLPYYFAIGSVMFFGIILISAAFMWALYHISSRHTGAGGWLKPFALFVIGLILLLFPEQSLVVLATFILIYLLFDAFGSFYFALEFKGKLSSWFLMLLNGFLDLVLAVILLYFIQYPKLLGEIIGILIGASLIVDGIMAIWYGWRLKVYYEKYKRLIEG